MTPFHALYTATELSSFSYTNRLTAAYASSSVEVYPFQVAAAEFALRSPYLKGAVLADEGSLGKTIEALLVISQLWYEGKDRILIIVPTPLLGQWSDILENRFSVPFVIDDLTDIGSVVLTTYEHATQNAEFIEKTQWNIVVFEEAHRLSNHESKTAIILKESVGDTFKLLLTATPMQNSIMDLYGLIHFIDDGILGDKDEFYKRYFRKPENYHELTSRISRYVFRTLRCQVESYVKIPKRIPITLDYKLTSDELKLSAKITEYLKKPEKQAFPKMDEYDLTLMFCRAFSSSTFAFEKLLQGTIERIPEPELVEMQTLAAKIATNAKGTQLLKIIKKAFAELKKKGANRKILIFTENRATQKHLKKLLKSENYSVLTHNGDKSRDYDIMRKFKDDADVLIATDTAAEGFNLEFCSFVVNYDLPYNVLALEQRIMRCHRQGQQNDVVVVNFLSRNNLADTRMLELINKRVLQFDGIVGMSDDVIGNFAENAADGLTAAFGQARHKSEIERDFQSTLAENEQQNTDKVQAAENALFTTFTRDIANKVTITPQCIKDRTAEINDKLWELVKWFFDGKSGYKIDENTRTLHVGIMPQKVFTGTALRSREYVLGKTITLTSAIIKNIRNEIFWKGIPDSGTVAVNNEMLEAGSCFVGYYRVKVGGFFGISYYTFVGKTADGHLLSDKECRAIMDLPVLHFDTGFEIYGDRDVNKTKPANPLDKEVDTAEFLRRAVADTDDTRREEIEHIKDRAYHQKQELNRNLAVLKNQLAQIENTLSRSKDTAKRIDAEKKKASTNRDLRQREQTLFLDGIRLDVDAENAVKAITEQANLTAEITRLFAIQFMGGNT